MSANYGQLALNPDTGNGEAYTGQLDVPFVLSAAIAIVPNKNVMGNQWEWKVKVKSPSGQWVDYGSAQRKPMKGDSKKTYLRMVIDGPSLDKPVWLNAFPQDAKDERGRELFDMVWQRPSANNSKVAGSNPAALDDEIPY